MGAPAHPNPWSLPFLGCPTRERLSRRTVSSFIALGTLISVASGGSATALPFPKGLPTWKRRTTHLSRATWWSPSLVLPAAGGRWARLTIHLSHNTSWLPSLALPAAGGGWERPASPTGRVALPLGTPPLALLSATLTSCQQIYIWAIISWLPSAAPLAAGGSAMPPLPVWTPSPGLLRL